MISRLLPPNRTLLESALADAMSLTADPGVIRTLADSTRCPAALLPWLAWAKSVDGWDEAMAEQPRRQLVQQSFAIHQHKGTAGAVRRAMAALGVTVDFTEWQHIPGAVPYTFGLIAWVNQNAASHEAAVLTPQLYQRLYRLVEQTRNERSHFSFQVGARFDQAMPLASASQAAAVGRWPGQAQAVQPAPAIQPWRLAHAARAAALARVSATPVPVQPAAAAHPMGLACAARVVSVLRVSMEVQ